MGLLEILIVVFFVLWLTGAFAFPAVGGSAVHLLLVIILILVILRLAKGKW